MRAPQIAQHRFEMGVVAGVVGIDEPHLEVVLRGKAGIDEVAVAVTTLSSVPPAAASATVTVCV